MAVSERPTLGSGIRHPEMRAELTEMLTDLASPALHEEWKGQPSSSLLDIELQELYDWYDFTEPAEAARGIGAWLRDEEELRALLAVGLAVQGVADEIGIDAPDQAFLQHPRWPAVVEAARSALAAMEVEAADR